MDSPVPVVDDRVHDGGHLLGEFRGVGREFLRRRSAPFLLGLLAALAPAVLVAVPPPLALLQADLLLHLLQVPVLDRLQGGTGMKRPTQTLFTQQQ